MDTLYTKHYTIATHATVHCTLYLSTIHYVVTYTSPLVSLYTTIYYVVDIPDLMSRLTVHYTRHCTADTIRQDDSVVLRSGWLYTTRHNYAHYSST